MKGKLGQKLIHFGATSLLLKKTFAVGYEVEIKLGRQSYKSPAL